MISLNRKRNPKSIKTAIAFGHVQHPWHIRTERKQDKLPTSEHPFLNFTRKAAPSNAPADCRNRPAAILPHAQSLPVPHNRDPVLLHPENES